MNRREPLRARILLSVVAILFVSCTGNGTETSEVSERSSTPTDSAAFRTELQALCKPVAEEHKRLVQSEDQAAFRENAFKVAQAELRLIDDLGNLDPPPELEDELATYVGELRSYSVAQRQAAGTSDDSRGALEEIVEAARSGVALERGRSEADLPSECPPPPGVDVHNTLFVARANLECFDLTADIQVAGPLKTPQSAKEIALVFDLGERVTAGIARVVKRSAGSQVEGTLVKEIIALNKKRFQAIIALRNTFGVGDYGAYRKAARHLLNVSREADRRMLSVGLIECSKVFGLLPF